MSFILPLVLGLLIGGILGAYGITILQQIRSGRTELPPEVALGPLKIDVSGLVPKREEGEEHPEQVDMAPFVEGGGSIAGGCLALIGAIMILVGFILPWASFGLIVVSGTFSGLSLLVQLVVGTLLSVLGMGGRDSALAGLGGLLAVVLIFATVVLVLIPVMGVLIGKRGLELIQSPRASSSQRKSTSKRVTQAAILGLIPLLCCITTSTANISGLATLGVSIRSAETGLWVTLGGFIVAILSAIVVSTAVAMARQLPEPPSGDGADRS